jgi:hypothetical protein
MTRVAQRSPKDRHGGAIFLLSSGLTKPECVRQKGIERHYVGIFVASAA